MKKNEKQIEEEITSVEELIPDTMEEVIEHEVTKEEIVDNNLEDVLEEGDIVKIPMSNTRVCTCGATVTLPNSSEDTITCECGIKHAL